MSSGTQHSLRIDNPLYPSFLRLDQPPAIAEARHRAVEWVLATWICLADPNVLGLRRVDEERNGQIVPTGHIAIPLAYQRRRLAQTLGLRQVEDEQATPRVNLVGSNGFSGPHSFIRVSLEILIERFADHLRSSLAAAEINDETISAPESVIQEYARSLQRERREEEHRLPSAVRHALAMRDLALSPGQVETLVNRRTSERWIRIKDVDKGLRTALRQVLKQAGVEARAPSAGNDSEWALLFPEREVRKLLS